MGTTSALKVAKMRAINLDAHTRNKMVKIIKTTHQKGRTVHGSGLREASSCGHYILRIREKKHYYIVSQGG